MEENESKQGQDYAQDLKIQSKIEEAIELAILQNKETVSLDDGRSIIVLKIVMGKERGTYDVFFADRNLVTVKRDNMGKLNFQGYKLDLSKLQNRYNAEKMRIILIETQREKRSITRQVEKGRENRDILPKEKQPDALRIEMEKKIANGQAKPMEIDRETSSTENMRMFIKRAWGVSAKEVYRVQGKDPHSFKYVVKTGNTKKPYEEIDLSHQREGRNSMQQITVMENGQFKKRTVSSLLLKGDYGIATAIPTSVASDNKTTYLVARTPKGKYIGIAAGEKQGVNRNTSSNRTQKDFMSRENSVYDLEDVIMAAELGEKIYGLNKDGKLTTEEVELVRRLKEERGMTDTEVVNTINAVGLLRKMGYDTSEIRRMMENANDAPKNKEETKKLAEDEEEYVGYGQRRPH